MEHMDTSGIRIPLVTEPLPDGAAERLPDAQGHSMASAEEIVSAVFREIDAKTTAALECGRSPSLASLVSSESWDKLLLLFGKNLEKACRIVDAGGVCRLSSPCGRLLFQVQATHRHTKGSSKGHSTEQYLCLPNHFCSCHSFFFDVISKQHQLLCKHLVAVRLATSLRLYSEIEISEVAMADAIMNI